MVERDWNKAAVAIALRLARLERDGSTCPSVLRLTRAALIEAQAHLSQMSKRERLSRMVRRGKRAQHSDRRRP